MKNKLITILMVLALLIPITIYSQNSVTKEDLKTLLGEWTGTLTYLDYTTNAPHTMPANLMVEQGKNESKLVLNNSYPNEPKANSSDKMKISKTGLLLNNHLVASKKVLENGLTEIQTEHEAKDDGEKSIIRYTYTFGSESFVIRKDVKFLTSDEWIKRSEFNYSRTE